MKKLIIYLFFITGCNSNQNVIDYDKVVNSTNSGAPANVESSSNTLTKIRVGSWNMKRLGEGSKYNQLAAKIIEDNFDIIAIQEVMNINGINQLLGNMPGWNYTISTQAVGTSYKEYYATLYRSEGITILSSYVFSDTQNLFEREPMISCFKYLNISSFCLISIHVIYGSTVGPRDSEIQALANNVISPILSLEGIEKDYIAVGDFNRSGSVASFSSFNTMGFNIVNSQNMSTTIGTNGYVNPYDHIIANTSETKQLVPSSYKMIDIVSSYCGGTAGYCSTNISDHAPVYVELDLSVKDNSLVP